jgi:hypothetical protein
MIVVTSNHPSGRILLELRVDEGCDSRTLSVNDQAPQYNEISHDGKSNNGTQNDQEEISDGRSTVANCRSNDGWMTITHRLQGLKVSEHFLSG